MRVQVRLFALAEELAGGTHVACELPEGCTIGELRERIGETVPSLVPLLPHLLIAVNEQYVRDSDPVPNHAVVAVFPPVSGG